MTRIDKRGHFVSVQANTISFGNPVNTIKTTSTWDLIKQHSVLRSHLFFGR